MENILLELTGKIEKWSTDRNLSTADPIKQFDKLIEEHGELVKGINKQDEQVIKDSIGDMFVVITIIMQQINGDMKLAIKIRHFGKYQSSTVRYIKELNEVGQKLYKFTNENSKDGDLFAKVQTHLSNVIGLLDTTSKEYNTDLITCVQLAYDEIKDRKGKMINGKFVKEADL